MTDATEVARLKARVEMLEYIIRVNGLRAGCSHADIDRVLDEAPSAASGHVWVAPCVSPQQAARIIVDEVLHKPCHDAVKLRVAMYDATLKTKAAALTRTVRWSVVNDAIEALAAYEPDGADK